MLIGELAKRASVSRDTIRFYERNGLISSEPSKESTNKYREYSENVVLTLELIQDAQAAGFTISELKTFMKQMELAHQECVIGEAFLDRKIREVEANITRSQKFLETLKATRAALAASP